jgi:hypothetical protein
MYLADSDPARRTPGQYARAAVQSLRMRTLVALGVLAVATAMLGRLFGLHNVLFLGAELALLVSMFVISRYVLPLVERRDHGARGEEHVGELLAGMPQESWRVVHDATLGRGNVDHIVMGPAGVFTVETKSHPGPVRVGRVHGSMLAQAQAQSRAIEEVTGLPVQPLIVFSRAWVDRPMTRRKGVRVVPARMLVGYLSKRPTTLTRAQVEEAYGRLARALQEQAARERAARERWRPLR